MRVLKKNYRNWEIYRTAKNRARLNDRGDMQSLNMSFIFLDLCVPSLYTYPADLHGYGHPSPLTFEHTHYSHRTQQPTLVDAKTQPGNATTMYTDSPRPMASLFFCSPSLSPPELLTLDNGAIGARRSNKVSEKKRRFTWVPCGNEARHSVLPTVVALAIEMGRESDNRSEKERKRKREAHRDELALRLSSLPLLFLLFPRLL